MGGFLKDILSFEKFKLGNALKKYEKDPERLLLGINTPFESKVWGKVTGKNYTPTVDMWGGATKDDIQGAKEKGINTGPGEAMHNIARTVASFYGAAGAAKGLSNAVSSIQASGAGSSSGVGAEAGASSGAGVSSGGGNSVASSGGINWRDYVQMASNASGGGGRGLRPISIEENDTSIIDKTASGGYLEEAMARYNSNAGPYNDGHTIRIADGNAYLLNQGGDVVGTAPADKRLYSALEKFENDLNEV